MQVGEVKCAEDVDFERLKLLCRCQEKLETRLQQTQHNSLLKSNDVSDFKVIKVSLDLDLPVDFDLSFEVPLHSEFPLLLGQHYYSTISFSLIENVDPAYVPTREYKIDLVF